MNNHRRNCLNILVVFEFYFPVFRTQELLDAPQNNTVLYTLVVGTFLAENYPNVSSPFLIFCDASSET